MRRGAVLLLSSPNNNCFLAYSSFFIDSLVTSLLLARYPRLAVPCPQLVARTEHYSQPTERPAYHLIHWSHPFLMALKCHLVAKASINNPLLPLQLYYKSHNTSIHAFFFFFYVPWWLSCTIPSNILHTTDLMEVTWATLLPFLNIRTTPAILQFSCSDPVIGKSKMRSNGLSITHNRSVLVEWLR